MRTYLRTAANEWVYPPHNNFKMACCDCGLVHVLDFRSDAGVVRFRARRDNRATAALRRERRKRQNRLRDMEAG